MTLYGTVSSIETDNQQFRVILETRDKVVSPVIPKAKHVGTLAVGDKVIVALKSLDLTSGVIIAAY